MAKDDLSVICIGAGPAGLTAGYLLSKEGVRVTVLEQDPIYVGGISKTPTYKGFAFDIGGHRFFSKSAEVNELWTELLGDDFLIRPRKSRIYYNRCLFDYPLRALDALAKLGIIEATRCVASYAKARVAPAKNARTFEQWVTNQFGRRLFQIFFKTYTEKVWGMNCSEISADWAAQRIKGLSLSKAIWHALKPQKQNEAGDKLIKTLINSFRYPRRGPGMLWEAAASKIRANGGEVAMGERVVSLCQNTDESWTVVTRNAGGTERALRADHVISSMPVRELMQGLSPLPDPDALAAARGLLYRDFLVVSLIVKERNLFDDNWIYIHDPEVKVGRIQNFKSWSPEMVPDPSLNCYGLEYFCFEGDGIWSARDQELIKLASDEIVQLGLAERQDIVDGVVVRQPKAYPIYDETYQERIAAVRAELDEHYPNLHLVGRGGMHKYNNQDHAMMTAMLTAKNILLRRRAFDVWCVNQDAEYHEDGEAGRDLSVTEKAAKAEIGGRLIPARV